MIELTTISDKQPTLKEAQKIVGGYVQMLHLPNGISCSLTKKVC